MKVSQEAALRRPREVERSCGQVRGGRGKPHHHLKSPPHTCYLIALPLTHGAGWNPKGKKKEKKPTVLHPVTQQLCCSDDRCLVWSHTVFKRNLYKRRFLSCVTDTFVCWGTIDVSKRVKWCIKYEWICVKCVYKSVDTQLHKEGRLIV